LRDLVAGQSRLLDQMSKKVASNDKTLENINTRMDTFAFAIKNQHSFNKMIESQIAQLVATVPLLDKCKIMWQPEDLETANLVDIHNAAYYYTQPSKVKWIDYSLPDKKCDPGRPVIPISIGCHIFREAI
jgi:predicted alpha/beta-fold hydrolase